MSSAVRSSMPEYCTSSSPICALKASRAMIAILARVGLRIAELLGLLERVGVRRAGRRHLRQDEVRRAVDDAVHALDVRARERLVDHADDRHDTADGGLEAQLGPARARGVVDL